VDLVSTVNGCDAVRPDGERGCAEYGNTGSIHGTRPKDCRTVEKLHRTCGQRACARELGYGRSQRHGIADRFLRRSRFQSS
jgi:hypothetical protein